MRKSRVLLIDNDVDFSSSVTEYLSESGNEVCAFPDGPESLEHIHQHGLPHIVLVNLALPSMHGFELANKLKSMADVPIIFVTSSGDKEIIVEGLKKYAEDFIVKPFDLRELEARIQVVLARMPSFDYASEPMIRVDENLSIDFAHNRIVISDRIIGLTPTESIMLHVLLRNATRVVENRMLIARVWPSEEVNEDTLRVHIHRLRRKLESDSHHPHYIRTERGVGYRFTQRPLT